MEAMPTLEKKFVLSHVLTNLSIMSPGDFRWSQPEGHFNVPWCVGAARQDEVFTVQLFCGKHRDANKHWTIKTQYDLKVVSVTGKYIFGHVPFTFSNTSPHSSCGFAFTIGWNQFIKDYSVHDSIIIEACVSIEEMTGIEIPERIRSFDLSASQFADVVLKVDDAKFYVSKAYLATHSTYFNTLFTGPFMESAQSEITLKNVDPQTFQCFLEHLYMEPSLTDSNVEEILQLTDMYDSKNGARLCEQFLLSESKHSVRTKIRIAARFKLQKLKAYCFDQLKTAADVQSAMGADLHELDPFISFELHQKTMTLFST